MDDTRLLARRFDDTRPHLLEVAYRMLGSAAEAEDAVQESWLRASRFGADGIDNLGGWLTTVVSRVCLDMLRARRSRREEPWDAGAAPADRSADARPATGMGDAEHEALLADSLGPALLIVLDTLSPAERIAFVLHDMFAVPFDEIAPIVDRSPAAARKLASRARSRVKGGGATPAVATARQGELVEAFLAASRGGDFAALLELLDPDVVLRADAAAVGMGAAEEVRGAADVAETFSNRARAARPAVIDGAAGLVWAPGGEPRVVFVFGVRDGRIGTIELVSDTQRIERLDLRFLDD